MSWSWRIFLPLSSFVLKTNRKLVKSISKLETKPNCTSWGKNQKCIVSKNLGFDPALIHVLFSNRPGSYPTLGKFQWLGSFLFFLAQYNTTCYQPSHNPYPVWYCLLNMPRSSKVMHWWMLFILFALSVATYISYISRSCSLVLCLVMTVDRHYYSRVYTWYL